MQKEDALDETCEGTERDWQGVRCLDVGSEKRRFTDSGPWSKLDSRLRSAIHAYDSIVYCVPQLDRRLHW
jgi:hypothetical protein